MVADNAPVPPKLGSLTADDAKALSHPFVAPLGDALRHLPQMLSAPCMADFRLVGTTAVHAYTGGSSLPILELLSFAPIESRALGRSSCDSGSP